MALTHINKILVANRGEIACRIMHTCQRMGIRTVAVYSSADRNAQHVAKADQAVCLGEAAASESYLNIDKLIAAARHTGAQAIHPGYGFLSENAEFARACSDAGLIFIGPSPESIEAMGSKARAKTLMEQAGVPLLPGYNGDDQTPELLHAQADAMAYPVLIKAVDGGGGRGIRIVNDSSAFLDALVSCQREALASFGSQRVLIERYLPRARHVEVQIFGDAHGNIVHLFERDCSVQRRHQKVIEEAPAPGLTDSERERIGSIAVSAARAIHYRGAGTVEFIAPVDEHDRIEDFYFMEMNTRLQVEHPVTEMITGQDLVEWQIRVARGEPLPLSQSEITCNGHAIEVRICAEDPFKGFLPGVGKIESIELPCEPGRRLDSGYSAGDSVSAHYDSLIAKLICWGQNREAALLNLGQALQQSTISGIPTNLDFLFRTVHLPAFAQARLNTGLIQTHQQSLLEQPQPDIAAIALAIAAQKAFDKPTGNHANPWLIADAWRLSGLDEQVFCFETDSHLLEAVLSKHASVLTFQGQSWPFEWQADATGSSNRQATGITVRLGEQGFSGSVYTHRTDPLIICVRLDGTTFYLQCPDPYQAIEHDSGSDAPITSPMPGQILKLHCESGQRVVKGQELLVMTAMKMETTVTAPRDGVVDEILCEPGQQVSDGQTLITLSSLSETTEPV